MMERNCERFVSEINSVVEICELTFSAWFLPAFGFALLIVAVAGAAAWLNKKLTGD